VDAKDKEFEGLKNTIQVAPETVTRVVVCALKLVQAKNKSKHQPESLNMAPQLPLRKQEAIIGIYSFQFRILTGAKIKVSQIRQQQINASIVCSSLVLVLVVEKTPYVKLMSQLICVTRAIVCKC
jgi:pyruvate-ferredoxin/flavodoxin oxidoreductase